MKSNYIVYHAFGNKIYYQEAVYSIISYLQTNTIPVYFVVYTDDFDYFTPFEIPNLLLRKVTDQQIHEYKGKEQFIFRVKIKLLQDFFAEFEGNCLYLDTDTHFFSEVGPLFNDIAAGTFFMEWPEFDLFSSSSRIAQVFQDYFSKNGQYLDQEHRFPIQAPFQMINAGALGMRSSEAHRLADVLEITDLLYPKIQSHITEQFAFCYVFQYSGNPVKNSTYCVHHYWTFKEVRPIMTRFFEVHAALKAHDLIPYIDAINPSRLAAPKFAYKRLSFWQKLFQKMKFGGRKWVIEVDLKYKP
ncbi:MAG: hypothetical protein CFE24_02650 [Flavobacterium sp. BFFFF2]|nr:MAG: hypothetical protein CFE24_02650 [Flavobacterium sp. BFFFF2]